MVGLLAAILTGDDDPDRRGNDLETAAGPTTSSTEAPDHQRAIQHDEHEPGHDRRGRFLHYHWGGQPPIHHQQHRDDPGHHHPPHRPLRHRADPASRRSSPSTGPIAMAVRPSDGSLWVARRGGSICWLSGHLLHPIEGGGPGEHRRRAGAPRHRLQPVGHPPLRQLHRHRRDPPGSTSFPVLGDGTADLGGRRNIYVRRPAGGEPQRREHRLRARWPPLLGSGRRRWSRGSARQHRQRAGPRHRSRKDPSDRPASPRASSGGSAGCATPGGSASTGPTATCGWPTSAKGRGRRSTGSRRARSKVATWAGGASRGPTGSRPARPRRATRDPCSSTATTPAAPSRAATSTAAPRSPPWPAPTCTPTTATASCGASPSQGGQVRTQRGLGVDPGSVVSFGQSADGRPLRPHPRSHPAHRSSPVTDLDDATLLEVLHDTATAVRGALDGLADWGVAGTRPGQYRSDLAADEAALAVLDRAGLGVMSEESGLSPSRAGRSLVVLDPVDGSTNASRGLPWYATSLCAVDADGPRAALVVDQANGARFEAVRGGGARVDGQRAASPAAARASSESVVGLSGYPPHAARDGSSSAPSAPWPSTCAPWRAVASTPTWTAARAPTGPGTTSAACSSARRRGPVVADAWDRPLVTLDHAAVARRSPPARRRCRPRQSSTTAVAARAHAWPRRSAVA